LSADNPVSVGALTTELQGRVRERVRADLIKHGASPAFEDPALFNEVERLVRDAIDRSQPAALLLPQVLGEPSMWRLETAMRYQSHRGGVMASLIVFAKRRLMMPIFRWLFEYSRDNFERQRRLNHVLFACVQELAIETARLRQEVHRLSSPK
jgi:hypothetical protein